MSKFVATYQDGRELVIETFGRQQAERVAQSQASESSPLIDVYQASEHAIPDITYTGSES